MNRREGDGRRVAISQSNYIPWRGYFDMIGSVDEFIFYDDVQYTKDWRNRNRIKTPQGPLWLTIPVGTDRNRRICDVTIPDEEAGRKHWQVLTANYKRAPHFEEIAGWLRPHFDEPWTSLSLLNHRMTAAICDFLGIRTKLSRSYDYQVGGDRNGRLLALCQEVGGTTYLSGPRAADYLDEQLFEDGGVAVEWMDYSNYAEYPQLWGKFEPQVSILDLLFNCGLASRNFLKVGAS
mgnify:FL=1